MSNILLYVDTHCGACKSLFEEIPNHQHFINIKKCLKLGLKAKEITLKKAYENKEEKERAMEKNSVLCQVENLHTYPAIKEKLLDKSIKLHAWYIHLEGAKIEYYDEDKKHFRDIINYEDFKF